MTVSVLAVLATAVLPAAATAAVDARINFQPAGAIVPLGYTADSGGAFTPTRGFGWVREDSLKKPNHVALDVSPNAVDRGIASDQRLDTFIQMQYPRQGAPAGVVTEPAAWEMVVPNGSYDVVVSVGDAGSDLNSSHRINVEGSATIANFVPTSANHFRSATTTVNVGDGRLTIDARGGTNTKINYVDVATTTDRTPPAAPSNVRATAGDGRVALQWSANTESDLAGYHIYRATSQPVSTAGASLSGSSPLTTASYTDTAVTNGTTYYYVVVAVDTSGNRAASATVSATPAADTTAPTAPVNVSATPGDAQVTLNWNANAEPDLRGYDVYRSTALPVPTGGTPLNGTAPLTVTTYTDLNRTNGTTYHYVVGAVDTSGNRSFAAPVSATPSADVPAPPTDRPINFQPAGAPTPTGWSADTGAPYSETAGQGWVREDSLDSASHVPLDIAANARDRNAITDQLLDTFIHMQYPPAGAPSTAVVTPGAWELKVPTGDYTVLVSVGDSGPTLDSVHRINVEGQIAINNFVPTSTNKFQSATRTVRVTDGRLTIDARGGTNTKIDYVRVTSATADATPPAAPTNVTATPGDARVVLAWNANTEPDLAGYDVFRSTSLPVSTAGSPLNSSTLGSNGYTDTTAVNGTTYHYVVVAKDTSGNRAAAAAVSATPQGAVAVDRRINFQPAGAAIPTGYSADTGAPYSSASGQGWVRQDSLSSSTHVGLDVSPNARDRNVVADQRLDTFIHMQYPALNPPSTAVTTPAAWELALPPGGYTVTVGVGDANDIFDSVHRINIEGQVAMSGFVPAAGDKFAVTTRTVNVADGRLTIDATGGTNTKIDYVTVVNDSAAQRPSVTSVSPADGAASVVRDAAITAEVRLPNVGSGVDQATLNSSTVRLIRNRDGAAVSANRNTTGGGDAIILQPTGPLEASTRYRVEITNGLKDLSGAAFLPFDSTFTTGTSTSGSGGGNVNASFTQVSLSTAQGQMFTSVTMGPDQKLYAGTYDGKIYRFAVGADGATGTPEVITSLQSANGGNRTLLGMAFDPAATASNLILWVSHNQDAFSNATDWTGKVSRMSGSALGSVQDYVVGLPRSVRDHETNSLAFGPDGALYVTQGSNTATGAPDSQWGFRPEHVLNAAVLRIDRNAITTPPLNVKSEDGGSYDPFAAGAPVTVYGSGVRNAFDLVWHTNGQLYVPTNGSAAGGNTPASPSPLPSSCQKRIDSATRGAYTGPAVPGLSGIPTAQRDYLFRVQQGGYYGHPNASRCEWVLNGGNPTTGTDPAQVSEYPAGTAPDRNWRGSAFDFGEHYSPNGVIEYRNGTAFGGALQGKLLVVRYSAGDDILVLSPGANFDIASSQAGIPGLTGFVDPLDLTEDRRNGNLYVTELGANRITLLRPNGSTGGSPTMATTPSRLIFNDVAGTPASAPKNVTVRNEGTAPLSLSGLAISGTDAAQFRLVSPPSLPATIAAGSSAQLQVVFDPTSAGPKRATLTVSGNDTAHPQQTVALRGLGTQGLGGTSEPSLQWILDTYDIPVNVGDSNPADSSLPTTALLGDEVPMQRMIKASSGNVTIEPLAVFGPQSSGGQVTNLGWQLVGGGTRNQLFSVANADYQSLDPVVSGSLSFDPGSGSFGMSSIWPFFSNREVFLEDARNTFTGAIPHHVRAYPLKSSTGSVVSDAYVIAFEENTSGFDYQDLVYIVRNVQPAPTSGSGGQIAVTNLDGVPFNDRMVFNRIGSLASPPSNGVHDRAVLRISNTGSGALRINSITPSGPWTLVSPPALPATIAAGGQLDVTVRFIAESGSTHAGTLTISSDDTSTPSRAVQLAGHWQPQSENGWEPLLPTIVNTIFGYQTTLLYSGQTLNRAGRVETAGEEVLSAYWSRVDATKPVTVRQLDAYHTQGSTATIFWHTRGSTTTNTIFTHAGIDGQSLLPRLNGSSTAPAAGSFSPGAVFGFKIDTEWSDDALNDQTADRNNGCPGPCGHHLRFWPARDRAGNRIADAWILTMDYSGINYDYNDNVYLVGNIKPEGRGPLLHRLDVAGSSNYTDSLGQSWRPDTGLFSPSTAPAEGATTTPLEIADTIDDPIYQTYRGNVGAVPLDQRILSYALPTSTATSVDLRLHFAERYSGNNAVGRRVFDISGEGRLLVDNFDIFARTGAVNKAYALAIDNVAVTDGTLNLVFKAEVDYPSIAGIEVFCRGGC